MLIKEFVRRMESYMPLNVAAGIFVNRPEINHIYKVQLILYDRKCTTYVVHVTDYTYNDVFKDSCIALYFDKFTLEEFKLQYKYFRSFYNRCSQFQKRVLRENQLLCSLVFMLDL